MSTRADEGLRREIGVIGLAANMTNIMIGAGIFVLPALMAARLGSASLLAYGICALLIGAVMLCFAEVGSKVTLSGGVYTYIETAFGKYAGFLAANVFVFAGAVTSDAAVANALLDTATVLSPAFAEPLPRAVVIVVLFGGLALTNVLGVKHGIGLVQLCTFGKLTPLLMLAFLGWRSIETPSLAMGDMPTVSSLGAAALLLFFAFQGAETALSVGGEIREPQRTIPRALVLSISCVLALYVAIQLVCQGVLGPELATQTVAPLAETARVSIGPAAATFILVGAAISMFGNVSGGMLNIPRILYGAARDRVIVPRALATIHPRFKTPHYSILTYMCVVMLFAIVGDFGQLAVLSSATLLLIYLGVVLAVLRLRKTLPGQHDGFRVPGGPMIPIATAIAILWFLSNLTRQEVTWMIGFVGFLTLIHAGMRRFRGTSVSG